MSIDPALAGSAPSTSSVPPVGPPSDPAATAAKRKYDELVAALDKVAPASVGPTNPSKRAKRSSMDTKEPYEKIISMSKFFHRGVHPFYDIGLVMFLGAHARWAAPVSSDPSNTVVVPPSQLEAQQKYVVAFNKMLSVAPHCADLLQDLYKDEARWASLIKQMRKAAADARQSDTSTLKSQLHYLPADRTKTITPALANPKAESKSDRGINHPMLREAIISRALRHKITRYEVVEEPEDREEDEEASKQEPQLTAGAQAALEALLHGCRTVKGKPAVTASSFPSCFYADGADDLDAPEVGLFRAPFLLRVTRHIWTAPSSAMDGAQEIPQVCAARAHNKFTMDAEMLGYVCCQARTMISTSAWVAKDGKYDYNKLFDSVVALFADPTDSWAVETLDWFQKGVFDCGGGGAGSDDDGSDDEEESEMASLAARRAIIGFQVYQDKTSSYNRFKFTTRRRHPAVPIIACAPLMLTECSDSFWDVPSLLYPLFFDFSFPLVIPCCIRVRRSPPL
ncbi:hypothetical protein DFH06DRAFT_1445807 [Mycena polygramma]|nr:hypothetical protein DFH06DRAFT_1445807 [Mycena polygramma]